MLEFATLSFLMKGAEKLGYSSSRIHGVAYSLGGRG
jgi:hypothetical protein